MENKIQRPLVGIGVMVLKDGKVLLAKRKGSHGDGDYSMPGGHLEFGESLIDCAIRETKEETGIEIESIRFVIVSNITYYTNKHYVLIGFVADWKNGTPEVLER